MTLQNDPFAEVRLKPIQNNNDQKSVQQEPIEQLQNPNESDPFSEVRIKEAEGFLGIKSIGRNAARLGSRIAETLGGIPGDIESLINSGIFGGYEKISGKKFPEELKTRTFPTSGEIKEKVHERFGEFMKPENDTEKTLDEYTEMVSSLVGPMKFRKALGIGLASQMAKEGIKLTGLGERSQEAGKLGTMFFLSALNPGGALKYSKSQFEKANKLAKGASINASKLESNLNSLISDLEKGVTTSIKNSVLKPGKELIEKINNGKISVQDLMAAKRDVNSIMGEPETLKGAKKLLKQLGNQIDLAIKPFEKMRPDFEKAYRPANEIFGAVMEGNKASNFLKKTLGAKSVLGATIAEIALGHPEAIAPTLAGASGVFGSAKAVDFFTRMSKSPELRKYYNKLLLSAAKEDVGMVKIYADKIEKKLGSQ